jgi:tetratricopeptide (TPR) repeat protein
VTPYDSAIATSVLTRFCAFIHCQAHNNLGVIHKDRGNLEQAVHHYSLALSASPSFAQSLNNCAVIYTMLGKLDEAHEYCSRAIRASPTYAEA